MNQDIPEVESQEKSEIRQILSALRARMEQNEKYNLEKHTEAKHEIDRLKTIITDITNKQDTQDKPIGKKTFSQIVTGLPLEYIVSTALTMAWSEQY